MKKLLLLFPLVTACAPNPSSEVAPTSAADSRLVVIAVNYPLLYFAERIGGEFVRVEFPAPAGEDPAFWSPAAQTIVDYQQADLILLNGANYARWVESATLPSSRLVNTSAALGARLISIDAGPVHNHGPEGEHSHGETAFTTWLDLDFATEQARAITLALISARPQEAELFEGNFTLLEAELRALGEQWQAIVNVDQERPILGSHPVYQYLAARHALNLKSVHWEPNEMPGDAQWRELESLLESHPARFMFWEAEPLPQVVERLEGLGIRSAVFSPCGNHPGADQDWLKVMQSNTATLEAAFSRH